MKKYLLSCLLIIGVIQAQANHEKRLSDDSLAQPVLGSESDLHELIKAQRIKYAYSVESNWQKGYFFSVKEDGRLGHITPENPISEEIFFLDERLVNDSPELFYSKEKKLGGYLHQQLFNDRVKSITYFAGVDFVGAFVSFYTESNDDQTIMYCLFSGESGQPANSISGYCASTEDFSECFAEYSIINKKMSCSCASGKLIITRIE